MSRRLAHNVQYVLDIAGNVRKAILIPCDDGAGDSVGDGPGPRYSVDHCDHVGEVADGDHVDDCHSDSDDPEQTLMIDMRTLVFRLLSAMRAALPDGLKYDNVHSSHRLSQMFRQTHRAVDKWSLFAGSCIS